jgi:hypothetical protein
MVPRGADAVVMVEHTEPVDDGDAIEVTRAAAPGQLVAFATIPKQLGNRTTAAPCNFRVSFRQLVAHGPRFTSFRDVFSQCTIVGKPAIDTMPETCKTAILS